MYHYRNKLIIIVLLVVFGITKVQAQEVHGNPNAWYLLLTNYKINDKWNIGNELHMRYDDWHKDEQTFIIRPFVDYTIVPTIVVTVGYSYVLSYPYGDYSIAINRPEHNVWEQVTLKQNVGTFKILHRYRWEHRFSGSIAADGIGGNEIDGFDYSNRFRYRLTVRGPLNDDFFVQVFDELWVRSDDRLANTNFDRNWIYTGIGYNLSQHFSLQLAFLHQYAQNNPDLFERHSGFQITGELTF